MEGKRYIDTHWLRCSSWNFSVPSRACHFWLLRKNFLKKKKATKGESWCKFSGERRTIFPPRMFESLKKTWELQSWLRCLGCHSCHQRRPGERALQVAAESERRLCPWPASGGAPALVSEALLKMWVLIPFCRFVLMHRELVFMMRCLLYNMTVCILPKYRGLLQRISHISMKLVTTSHGGDKLPSGTTVLFCCRHPSI